MKWIDWFVNLFNGQEAPPVLPNPNPNPTILPDTGGILRLHNKLRQSRGMLTLIANTRLNNAAQEHAESMATNAFLSHLNLLGRVRHVEYNASKAGENIACGKDMDAQYAFDGWANSRDHLANMVDPVFHDVGFGFAVSKKDGQTYWCAIYGREQ